METPGKILSGLQRALGAVRDVVSRRRNKNDGREDGASVPEETPRTALRTLSKLIRETKPDEKVDEVVEEKKDTTEKEVVKETPKRLLTGLSAAFRKRKREEETVEETPRKRHSSGVSSVPFGSPEAQILGEFASPSLSFNVEDGGGRLSLPFIEEETEETIVKSAPEGSVGGIRRKRQQRKRKAEIPQSLIRGLFRSSTSLRVSKPALDTLVSAVVPLYLRQVSLDLSSLSQHARRRTVDSSDFQCLMRRQRILQEKKTLDDIVRKELPMEYVEMLIPKTRTTGVNGTEKRV